MATAAFLSRWRSISTRRPAALVKLTVPSSEQIQSIQVGVNDVLDFNDGSVRSVTLAPGEYRAAAMAQEVQSKLQSVGHTRKRCGFSFHIVQGFNDRLDFDIQPVAVQTLAILRPGIYTGAGLAAEAQRAMRAATDASGTKWFAGILVTYNTATNRFLFDRGGGNIWVIRSDARVVDAGHPSAATTAWGMFGFRLDQDQSSSSAHGSTYTRIEGRFWIQFFDTGTNSLLFASGVNAIRSAHHKLGYSSTDKTSLGNAQAETNAIFLPSTAVQTQDIFLSTSQIETPAGASDPARTWEPGIDDIRPIRLPGAFMSNDVGLCTTSIRIARRKLGYQADGKTILDALRENRFDGSAVVTIWRWEQGLTSFDDAQQVFRGTVQTFEADLGTVTLHLRQRTDWNKPIAPTLVTKSAYPRTPDGSIGLPVPIQYGKINASPMRDPFPAPYDSLQRVRELIAGGSRVSSGILVDTGRGPSAGDGKVLVASHAVKQLGANSPNYGTGQFLLAEDGRLHVIDPLVGDLFTAAPAGFEIPDGANVAIAGIMPVDVNLVANNAKNPRLALDPVNEVTFSRLDYAASFRDLQLRLPTVIDPGTPSQVRAYIVYRTAGAISGPVTFQIRNTVTGNASGTNLTAGSAIHGSQVDPSLLWDGAPLPTVPWNFGDCVLRVFFDVTAPAGVIDVFFMGLIVWYRPRRNVLQSEREVGRKMVRRPIHRRIGGATVVSGYRTYDAPDVMPPVTELRGRFFSNLHGQADTGTGTYTGVISALIERPSDIAWHLLAVYGGADPATGFELVLGANGSFADARNLLKTWKQSDMVLGLGIGETVDVMTAITWIQNAACSWMFISPYDDKWRFVPWRESTTTNYAWRFSAQHISDAMGPSLRKLPDSDVAMGVRLAYGYNAATGSFEHETLVGEGRSSGGHLYRNLRDGSLEVFTGLNDKVDFTTAGGTFACTLTPGRYDGITLARHLAGRMKAADTARTFIVAYGPVIVQGYNDKLDFNDGSVRLATVAAGAYATMEALATAVQAAMNAASSGYTVTYSRTTRRFTIARATSFTILAGTGANRATSVLPSIGGSIVSDFGTASSVDLGNPVEEERFNIATSSATLSLLWATGANTATNAAELLGFDPNEDMTASPIVLGYSPKSNLEHLFAASRPRYGPKREVQIEGRAIYDTDTAREIRTRVARLAGASRLTAEFSTEFAPDLDRGQIFDWDADMNAVMPYTDPDSDGSWVGKSFVAVQINKGMGFPFWQDKIEAVSLGAPTY